MNYHNDKEYYSKSLLSKFLDSPLEAYLYMHSDTKKDTQAMNFGRAYHSFIDGSKDFIIVDEANRPNQKFGMSAKENAAWLQDIKLSHETVITQSEMQQIELMFNELMKNDVFAKIHGAKQQDEQVFKTELQGVKVKCKPDKIVNEMALIIDYKTCQDIKEKTIYYSVRDYNYDMQAALYCDILYNLTGIAHNFLLIFQEKNEPFDVLPVLIRFDSDTMIQGREKYQKAIEIAEKCKKTGLYLGVASKYEGGIYELN